MRSPILSVKPRHFCCFWRMWIVNYKYVNSIQNDRIKFDAGGHLKEHSLNIGKVELKRTILNIRKGELKKTLSQHGQYWKGGIGVDDAK